MKAKKAASEAQKQKQIADTEKRKANVASESLQAEALKGLALGAARFLTRPLEPAALLAEIKACLAEQEMRQ